PPAPSATIARSGETTTRTSTSQRRLMAAGARNTGSLEDTYAQSWSRRRLEAILFAPARHSSPADLSRELATAFSCSRPLPAGGVQVMGTAGRINCSHQAAGQFLIFAWCDPVKVAACNNTNEVRTGARERATRPRRLRPLPI